MSATWQTIRFARDEACQMEACDGSDEHPAGPTQTAGITKAEPCHGLAGVATRLLLPLARSRSRSHSITTPTATEQQ